MRERRWRKEIDRGVYFSMCGKKKKLKSKEASRLASIFGQRKYDCPICGHWHLTKESRKK